MHCTSHFCSKQEDVIGQIEAIVLQCLQKTGFFHSGPPASSLLLEKYALKSWLEDACGWVAFSQCAHRGLWFCH